MSDYYEERASFLKLFFSEVMFNELSGTSWFNACAELFPTMRIHIAKINFFGPIADSYNIEHWKAEVVEDVRLMLVCKKSGWKPNAKAFMSNVDMWLESFSDKSILNKIDNKDYEDYCKNLISYYSFSPKDYRKKFLDLLAESRQKCDDVFRAVMSILIKALQDRAINTKKASIIELMVAIKSDIESKLNELALPKDD
ncbi:MAG: hypothetical protein IJP61_03350 [Treponema sp.]|nr:hypothetical protein [Treponema sp.]